MAGTRRGPGAGRELRVGVVSEVHEETGVHVEVERLTGVYENLVRGVVALVFRCRLLDGTPGPTEESADAGWFDLHETERLLVPAVAIRLLDAARPAGTPPASRVHDGTDVR